MAGEPLGVCIDRVIPEELEGIARAKNAVEHGQSKPSAIQLALASAKMWKPGRTLRVCFLDGDPKVHDKIESVAKQWMQYANIVLDFVDGKNGDIRISFKEPGYWSALGTDGLVEAYFPKTAPTMNFEGFSTSTPDDEYSRVVLHEFGHALGCIHEHQSPAGGIQWNKEVVYRELSGPPNNWSQAQVDHNVFNTYQRDMTQFTAFDPKSIMLYSFPKRWTTNNMAFTTNRVLSDTDKKFIADRYPKKKNAD
jgi:serralysin